MFRNPRNERGICIYGTPLPSLEAKDSENQAEHAPSNLSARQELVEYLATRHGNTIPSHILEDIYKNYCVPDQSPPAVRGFNERETSLPQIREHPVSEFGTIVPRVRKRVYTTNHSSETTNTPKNGAQLGAIGSKYKRHPRIEEFRQPGQGTTAQQGLGNTGSVQAQNNSESDLVSQIRDYRLPIDIVTPLDSSQNFSATTRVFSGIPTYAQSNLSSDLQFMLYGRHTTEQPGVPSNSQQISTDTAAQILGVQFPIDDKTGYQAPIIQLRGNTLQDFQDIPGYLLTAWSDHQSISRNYIDMSSENIPNQVYEALDLWTMLEDDMHSIALKSLEIHALISPIVDAKVTSSHPNQTTAKVPAEFESLVFELFKEGQVIEKFFRILWLRNDVDRPATEAPRIIWPERLASREHCELSMPNVCPRAWEAAITTSFQELRTMVPEIERLYQTLLAAARAHHVNLDWFISPLSRSKQPNDGSNTRFILMDEINQFSTMFMFSLCHVRIGLHDAILGLYILCTCYSDFEKAIERSISRTDTYNETMTKINTRAPPGLDIPSSNQPSSISVPPLQPLQLLPQKKHESKCNCPICLQKGASVRLRKAIEDATNTFTKS